jgi:tetratricopeptide (TPR) repeat protein
VGPGSLASADTARNETLLPLRPRYRGAPRAPLHESAAFWALLALAPLPAITLRRRSVRRPQTDRSHEPSRRLAATVRAAAKSRDASSVRRAYTIALSERLTLQPESFTRAGGLARVLRRRGVSTGIATQAERFLRELDEAAFAAGGALPADAAERAERLFRAVDDEALPRAQIVTRLMSVLVIAALGAAAAHAVTVQRDPRRAFDAGVEAYGRHEFVAARESFLESVQADPRAPDAWANLGTAAWAVADTARSVAAWQRALRLEPLAADVRERVELVHSLPWTASGFVPPVPVEWVFAAGAFVWFATWGWAALRARRGVVVRRTRLASLGVAAGIVVVCGFALAERLAGRHLDVLRYTASLTSDPEIGGERGPTAIIGEVVREIGRQGAWTRVRLDDGRDGWVETAALISLDTRDASQIAN